MAVAPKAPQLFAAESEATEQLGSLASAVADGARAVLFSCAQCGAHLKVTADSTRILTCSYCDTDLFLPDALWRAAPGAKAPIVVGSLRRLTRAVLAARARFRRSAARSAGFTR